MLLCYWSTFSGHLQSPSAKPVVLSLQFCEVRHSCYRPLTGNDNVSYWIVPLLLNSAIADNIEWPLSSFYFFKTNGDSDLLLALTQLQTLSFKESVHPSKVLSTEPSHCKLLMTLNVQFYLQHLTSMSQTVKNFPDCCILSTMPRISIIQFSNALHGVSAVAELLVGSCWSR